MEDYENRICPDLDSVKDHLRVKNDYSNVDDRDSFQIEIVKCNKSRSKNCRDNAATQKMLDTIFFTFYYIDVNVEFGNIDTPLHSNPLIVTD